MSEGVLAKILAAKAREIAVLRADAEAGNRAPAPAARTPLDVANALRRSIGTPLRLVTEIKRRSPSAGPLSTALSAEERALRYAASGASMISVLCDAPFFDGSWQDVAAVRHALDHANLAVPVLAKEFVLDEIQIETARANGADAVLLIARIVDAATLARLVRAARTLDLEPLVEVVTEPELEAALAAGATLIGVNARDLDTLQMDAERASRVLEAIPRACVAVHLSGLKGPADVADVAKSRADAALIGEALMRKDDPAELLRAMVAAGS